MKQYHFPQIESTNDFAKELLKSEQEVVVTADFQTKGRGRSQRNWEGDYGANIYFSYGLCHTEEKPAKSYLHYQISGCLATLELLKTVTKKNMFILKYPNDIYAKVQERVNRKISGILIEHTFLGDKCTNTVIGIGINVNQTIFTNQIVEIATSLKILGFDFEIQYLIDQLEIIIKKYISMGDDTLFELWRNELNIEGKDIIILSEANKWKVQSLQRDGRLLIQNLESDITRKIDDGQSIRYNLD
mgnify:CR=1 FL=1